MNDKIKSILVSLTPEEKEELREQIELEQICKLTPENIRKIAEKLVKQ
jgi:DNA-directed RNA polymerase subunit F